MCISCLNKVVLSLIEFNPPPPLFPGVVSKPAGQVASAGEAGGELHQAPGHLLLLAVLQLLSQQLPGLWSAAGPLALHPHHHLHLPAVPPGLHHRLTGPPGHLHPFSSPFRALCFAGLLPHLPGPGTEPPPASHGLHVPSAPGLPLLSWSKELQYSLTEDEGQGTHSVYWEDVVMLSGGSKWTSKPRMHHAAYFEKLTTSSCWRDCYFGRVASSVDI